MKTYTACVGSISTTVNRMPCSGEPTTCVLPVGCKKVKGLKSNSASPGNADTHCRSLPLWRAFFVMILKMRDSLLNE